MSTATLLRIVVLASESDLWCVWCGLPCGTAIVYLVEHGDETATAVRRLIYCDGCDVEAPLR